MDWAKEHLYWWLIKIESGTKRRTINVLLLFCGICAIKCSLVMLQFSCLHDLCLIYCVFLNVSVVFWRQN